MHVSHVGVIACPQARQHRLLRRHHCRLRVQLHLHRFRAVSYIAAPLDLLAFPWSACGIPGAFRHRFDIWSAPRWLCLGRPHTFLLPWLPGPSFVRAVSGTPYARVFAVFLAHIPFAVRVFVLPWEQCVQLRIAVLGFPSGLIQARSAFPGSSQSFFLIACLVFPIPLLPLRVIGSLEPLFSVSFPAAQLSAALRFLLFLPRWL